MLPVHGVMHMKARRKQARTRVLRSRCLALCSEQGPGEDGSQLMQHALAHGRLAGGEHPYRLGHELESKSHPASEGGHALARGQAGPRG